MPLYERKLHLSAPTFLSKLENLGLFAGFLLSKNRFIRFSLTEMTSLDTKIKGYDKKIETVKFESCNSAQYELLNTFILILFPTLGMSA